MNQHPGKLLNIELKGRGARQNALAKLVKVPPSYVNMIIKGKRRIDYKWALRLEEFIGIPAEIWLELQNIYDLTKARKNQK